MKPVSPIIFMHIPKTAGTTVHHILHNQYRGELLLTKENYKNRNAFEKLNNEEKKRIKVLKGHFKFGIHKEHPIPATYFSFLRNPIDRSISEYNFMIQNKRHKFYPTMIKEKYTLKDLLENGIIKNFDNSHVRFFAGIEDLKFGEIADNHFELAKKNFDTYFEFFGIVERFDESLIYLKRSLNWKMPYYVEANVSDRKNYTDKFDDTTIELLKKYNQFDQLLYDYAYDKFEKLITMEGEGFNSELKTFKRINALQSPLRKLVRKIWVFCRKVFH